MVRKDILIVALLLPPLERFFPALLLLELRFLPIFATWRLHQGSAETVSCAYAGSNIVPTSQHKEKPQLCGFSSI